ncbi:MAG: branched-chain amino acid transport system permease protein [Clostridiales bacterium]|nr:branched-chain amino acid transport system permease protein [Clostridiales bacterium]MDK2933251.1 branched-chain amino acid transport system permease protein [Clostridiales bacterium]
MTILRQLFNNIALLTAKNKKLSMMLGIILFVLFPFALNNNYILHILIIVGIYMILGVSLNIVTGITGELDLGHAAFFGIGAYISSLFTMKIYNNFWLGLIIAAIVSFIFGIILGIPSLRIRGDYLAIVTLGFSEIVRYVLLNWQDVTNGPMGINRIPLPSIMGYRIGTKQALFYLVYALVIITIILVRNLSKSRFGRALVAIRENEIAAAAMGINVGYYKVWSFAISAAFAGVAGSLFAHYMSFISPMNFTSNESILILSMVVLGGKGSIIGSILGVSVLMLLPEMLRFVSMYRMLIYGIALIAMMIFKPKGIIPENRMPGNYKKISFIKASKAQEHEV